MRTFSCLSRLFVGALCLASLSNATETDPARPASASPSGTLLLLHYRWRHDTLSLVESQRVKAAVKRSRSAGRGKAGPALAGEAPRSAFSYELVGADGTPFAVRYLDDPGTRRVEVQDPGSRQLHQELQTLDSSDIFLRIPEAEARSIRFFRHAREGAAKQGVAGARQGAAGTGAAQANGTIPLGPEPAPAKTLIAEFPL